jgi:TonB family protein
MYARSFYRLILMALLAGIFLLPQTAMFGQEATESVRKVKSQVTPSYPDLAKKMSVHGRVKLEVTIAPDGRVKSVHVLGGHPLLVGAAQTAVQQWKYEPGPKETTQIVEFNFD